MGNDSDPLGTFHTWLAEAINARLPEPTAMALATVDAAGHPAVRMVLLKQADARGFTFYTNFESDKARQLAAHPHAELCFHWCVHQRQVRVRGAVERVADDEADTYFATRPYLSRIGAWASAQSRPLPGFAKLERAIAQTMVRFPNDHVPRPPHWGGYRVVPNSIELWTGKTYRLHERVRHTHQPDGTWTAQPLYP